MGHVYKAWDPSLSRFVAIKVVTGPGAADESFRRRFRKEALHLASVDHPNVIPVYAVEPRPFQSAAFSCQILGQWAPKDGPVLGADNVRCVQGDRAFRFSWGD